MKWLRLSTFLLLLVWVLTPTAGLAETSQDVTITAAGWVVEAPGGLILTYVSDYEVGISWTKGATANNTMIRAKYGSYPEVPSPGEAPTDGYLVYYGTANYTSDTAVSLDEIATPICYVAFSEDSNGVWSPQYAEASMEGFGMTTVAVALIVLVFTILAFWRRDAILYMLGVIGWLFMTFYLVNRDYPAENTYLPYAIAVFCLSVTIVMAVQAIRVFYSSRTTPPTSGEIQAAHRKKVVGLTKKRERPWWEE